MAVQGEKVGLYLSGQPVLVPGCNIYITQPKIKDIVLFGEDEFLIDVNLLGHTENLTNQMKQGNSQLETFSDFQLLMIVMNEEPTIGNSIKSFFELIFPDYDIALANGVFIEFYNNGALEKIECRDGVSTDIIPVAIVEFVRVRYPDAYFVEYKIDRKHYEVKLSNRLELKFNKNFNLLEIDD
jgi:hypothetical protein